MTHTRHNPERKPKRGRATPDMATRTRHKRLREYFARLRARDKRDEKELEDGLTRAIEHDE